MRKLEEGLCGHYNLYGQAAIQKQLQAEELVFTVHIF